MNTKMSENVLFFVTDWYLSSPDNAFKDELTNGSLGQNCFSGAQFLDPRSRNVGSMIINLFKITYSSSTAIPRRTYPVSSAPGSQAVRTCPKLAPTSKPWPAFRVHQHRKNLSTNLYPPLSISSYMLSTENPNHHYRTIITYPSTCH